MHTKKVASVSLLITGLLIVILGVIIGIMLQNAAEENNEELVCVNSKESPGYERWASPGYFTTRAYYWNISNKAGFLYRGERPKLRQRGPYVYSVTSKRIDVKFENGKVTSKKFEQAKFNKTLTNEECPTCSENDELTILNAGYLVKGKDLSQVLIPLVMNVLFAGLWQQGLNNSHILLQMGQADNQLKLPYPSNPAFGSWINSSPYFASLRKNYSVVEMNGLYSSFLNASKFGPFTDTPLLKKCLNGSLFSVQCGLALNLKFLSKDPRAAVLIQQLLCPDRKSACFNASNTLTYQALGAFIYELSKYVLFFLEKNNFGATTTRNQNDLTIGYVLRLPGDPTGIPIPGIVTSHANKTYARKVATSSTFYTCESMGDRFAFAAVGGESTVSTNLYPKASNEQLKVHGYGTQFPGRKSLKTCSTKYGPTETSYEIFISYFRFAIPFKYKEEVETNHISMHKYLLDESAVEVNNVTVFTKGVFDVSRVLEGPIYASLPGFLYGKESLYKDLGLDTPDAQKYESLVSIEPISGIATKLKLRLQLNGIIPGDLLAPGTNVTFLHKVIPMSWTEIGTTMDAEKAKKLTSKVFGDLQLSCGLLLALPIFGGVLVILGVALIVMVMKKREVAAVV